jgi:hypothetical protein
MMSKLRRGQKEVGWLLLMTISRKASARKELLQINVYLHGIYLSWQSGGGGKEMINVVGF